MIKIENVQICGWEPTIRGMRNPLNSWAKSDSGYGCRLKKGRDNVDFDQYKEGTITRCDDCGWCSPLCEDDFDPGYSKNVREFITGPNDKGLMERLAKGGPAHAKYRRFITVYLDILAPLYWWKEFETYKVGTDSNSCSTMHKIADKEFTLDDFSHEHLLGAAENNLCGTIRRLNYYRDMYLQGGYMYEEDGTRNVFGPKNKDIWWQMIQLLPSSYNQRRTIKLNYETLYRIYHDRKGHKLDEWNEFCSWIESLPLSEVITGPKIEEKEDSPWIPCTDENAKMPEEGDEVLCTLKEGWAFGNQRDVRYHVFEGEYKLTKEDCYDMPAANGKGYFEACNDWDEGQPLSVIAWMPKPKAYKE